MSNDISNHISLNTNASSAKTRINKQAKVNSKEYDLDDKTMDNSLNFLGTLGYAQVNMGKSTKKAVEEYIENPEYVNAHTEFCDGLVENGYPLEKAIVVSDEVFKTLQDKKIYPNN